MDPTTGRSRGFAFVVFQDVEPLQSALGQEHTIKNKKVNILASFVVPHVSIPWYTRLVCSNQPVFPNILILFQVAVKKAASKQGKIYVGKFNLPITEDEIRSHFEQVKELLKPFYTKLHNMAPMASLQFTFGALGLLSFHVFSTAT